MPEIKLLLVDDETPFLEAMTRRLTKRGFDIQTATNGNDALDILEKRHSNIEVVIRKKPRLTNLAVILVGETLGI